MELFRQTGSVLLVFTLLGVALWMLRRKGTSLRVWSRSQGRDRVLTSVERLALTPQHALHLVRIGEREVLVATHPQGCALLTEAKREMHA
jgi:flagellar biogenesis protein FliO